MASQRNKHSSLAVLMKMSSSVKLTRISFPEVKCFHMLCFPTLLKKNFVVWFSKLNIIESERGTVILRQVIIYIIKKNPTLIIVLQIFRGNKRFFKNKKTGMRNIIINSFYAIMLIAEAFSPFMFDQGTLRSLK